MDTKKEVEKQKEYIKKVKDINHGAKYHIMTMGCAQNENDSEVICGMLNEMGYDKTNKIEDANLIIINTCCIRENAEDRLFGKLGEAKKYHKKGSIIALCGCMMQEKHILDKLYKSYPYVDIIFGTHTLYKFPELLFLRLNGNKNIYDTIDIDGKIYEELPIQRNNDTIANITIMNGCNNFCTYCIVPYVRGRERSREPKAIIDEAKQAVLDGFSCINLLGQNVNSYLVSENQKGIDYEKYLGIDNFAKLLQELEKIDGIKQIKFLSPHPKDFTDDVIDTIAKSKKISRFIHMPLQSGSSSVLSAMNRKYTKQSYLDLIEKMKSKIPDLKLSTDIIVGFPGETEQDFEDTLDVVRKVGFSQIFMFIYSRRIGTVADKMENQVDEKTAHIRFDKLKNLYDEMVDIENDKLVGKKLNILVEGFSKNNSKYLTGRTIENKVVVFEGPENLIGQYVDIEITKNNKWYLSAKVIDKEK